MRLFPDSLPEGELGSFPARGFRRPLTGFSQREGKLYLDLPNQNLLPDLPQGAVVDGMAKITGAHLERILMGALSTSAMLVLEQITEFSALLRDTIVAERV